MAAWDDVSGRAEQTKSSIIIKREACRHPQTLNSAADFDVFTFYQIIQLKYKNLKSNTKYLLHSSKTSYIYNGEVIVTREVGPFSERHFGISDGFNRY